jgi:serine/threonine-protein kinase
MAVDTSTVDPLIGEVLDGRYRLDSRIARGGMATVYAGHDLRLDRPVAVKVMHATLAEDDAFVERFRREARSAARLSHPNVVAIYDQGEDAGRVYLVMEHVTGQTLREILRSQGRLSPAHALDVADGVLTALVAAHAAGLVHRDVKPENVIVTPSGAVKVADFGLARAIEATHHTVADGTLLGTVSYVAPEQVTTGEADPRTDVYSLGIVLFEMLTGTVPFSGGPPVAVAMRHVNEDVPAPSSVEPSVPRVCDNVVRAATRREPEERYPDAETMLSAVRRARSALGNADTALVDMGEAPTLITPLPPKVAVTAQPKAPKPPKPPQPVKARKRRRTFLIVALAVLLVAGVAGWWLASSPGGAGSVSTPRLVGLSQADAERALRDAGLGVDVGATEYSDTVASGLVASQDPDPGEHLKKGSTVTLHLSRGVRVVVMPDVAGKTEAEAKRLITAAGLTVGTTTRAFDDTVPEGSVVSASRTARARLAHDTTVDLVVSKGPPPVSLPNVVGQNGDKARNDLKALGLKVVVTLEFSDTIAKDVVIAQTPTGPATVDKGTTVTLRVSKGPEFVNVPNVKGEREDVARAKLEALGLKVDVQHVRNGHGEVVLDQDPQPGARVRVGTTVTLVMF